MGGLASLDLLNYCTAPLPEHTQKCLENWKRVYGILLWYKSFLRSVHWQFLPLQFVFKVNCRRLWHADCALGAWPGINFTFDWPQIQMVDCCAYFDRFAISWKSSEILSGTRIVQFSNIIASHGLLNVIAKLHRYHSWNLYSWHGGCFSRNQRCRRTKMCIL
mgnify:CR=1 FL=1